MNFVKSEPGSDPLVVEGYFPAPPAKVFKAWTDPAVVVKWFGHKPNSLHSATIDLRPGGKWRFLLSRDDDKSIGFEGQYQEIRPVEKLVFTWAHVIEHANGQREETPSSRIELVFAPKESGTFVRLIHSAISNEQSRRGIGGGWEASFSSLAAMLKDAENGLD